MSLRTCSGPKPQFSCVLVHTLPFPHTFIRKNHFGKDNKSCLEYFSSRSSIAQLCLTFCNPAWTAACQASLSITNSQSLLKLMPIKSVMPSNHLILCHPLLLLPSIFPSIRVFSNESVLRIRWPKYGSFSFSISPFNEYSGLISFRMDIIWKSKKSDS